MIFSLPWAWIGLVSIPALVVLYVLRRRARRRTVSSLLLWRGASRRLEGGRRIERFEAPPLFWLEFLVLLLLVVAAADPRWPTPESRRPLAVVLDDSFSMRAGGESSALAAARSALLEELDSSLHATVTLIAAGESPRILGDGPLAPDRVEAALDDWRAAAGSAALAEAVELALEIGGPRARLLVVTDQAAPEELAEPRLVWRAFGRPRANLAFVQAVRGVEGTCLVEVANFSDQAAEARIRIVSEGGEPSTETLRLEAGGRGRIRFRVPAGQAVWAEILEDALEFDGRVVLLAERIRPVRVLNEVGDEALGRLVDETLLASGRARVVRGEADLVVTDQASEAGAWAVRLSVSPEARPFVGPFVVDSEHPLAEGLSLTGVIWSGSAVSGEGPPVVRAGDVALLVDRERGAGVHEVVLAFRPELSTLQQTPNWPVLWWNLLEWRASSLPGLSPRNVRLGGRVAVTVEPGIESLRWQGPEGEERILATRDRRAEIAVSTPGVHEIVIGRESERFAANVLAPAESDLGQAQSGRWGAWEDSTETLWAYRALRWIFVLGALAGLVLHLGWTRASR